MIIPQALVVLAAAVLVSGCAASGTATTSSSPSATAAVAQSPDAPVSSPPVTIIASRTASGGLCVSGSTCEAVFSVASDGTWTLTVADQVQTGTLSPKAFVELTAATKATQIASAPPFTGTCPIAYDGQELVYTWVDASGATQTVSACDREVAADDPLVVALDQAQAEALLAPVTVPSSSMDAQAARTQAIANTLLGRPEEEAVAVIEGVSSAKLTARIVRRDAQTFPVTEDYSPTRINLSIHAGIVTDATVG